METSENILNNSKLFANSVFILIMISFIADMLLPGARQTNQVTENNRMPCHVLQISIMGMMAVYVCFNYKLPQVPVVLFWELSIFVFLSITLCHAVFISSRIQLITFTKFVYWPLGYMFFRLLASENVTYTKQLIGLIITFSLFAIWYYLSQVDLRAQIAERAGSASSNVGWQLLSIYAISLCLAVEKNYKGYLIGGIALLFVPLSLKRGAILAEAVLVITLLLVCYRLGVLGVLVRKYSLWILSVMAVWFLISITQLQTMIKRFTDVFEDGGSGRSQIYPLLYERWRNADMFQWIFGYGFWSTPEYLGRIWLDGIYAHSDTLELLHDYGIIGVLSYLMILIGLFLICLYTWRSSDELLIVASSIFCLFLVNGIISGNVMFRETVYLMMPLGFVTGRLET